MVRTLSAQADAIWPQERPLFARYALPRAPDILDAGCGTGEITYRLGELLPAARLLGVDLIDEHLERARDRCAPFGARARFEHRSIFELGLRRRHVRSRRVPPRAAGGAACGPAIAELVRVTKPGGWLHLIAEDYLMINFEPRRLDPDDFWGASARQFGQAIGTDLRIGRHDVPDSPAARPAATSRSTTSSSIRSASLARRSRRSGWRGATALPTRSPRTPR